MSLEGRRQRVSAARRDRAERLPGSPEGTRERTPSSPGTGLGGYIDVGADRGCQADGLRHVRRPFVQPMGRHET